MFGTWQSLCMVGQPRDDEAVELLVAAVLAAVHTQCYTRNVNPTRVVTPGGLTLPPTIRRWPLEADGTG